MTTTTKARPTETPATIKGSLKSLFDAIKFVRYAISKEETRYYLGAVYFDLDSDGLKIRATDGHRLHQVTLEEHATPGYQQRFALSRDSIAALLKSKIRRSLLATYSFGLDYDAHVLTISNACGVVSTWSCDYGGERLDLDRVQPRANTPLFHFKTLDLAQFFETASAERSCATRFSADKETDTLALSAQHYGCGSSSVTTKFTAAIEGAGLIYRTCELGADSTYLLEICKAFGNTIITFKGDKTYYASSPLRIDDGSNRHVVLMPMRI